MQPLLLLKQTLDASFDPGPLLLEGPNVTFTSTDQFLSRLGKEQSCGTFDVGIAITSGIRIDLSFKGDPEKGIQIREERLSNRGEGGTLRPDMTSAEIEGGFSFLADEWFELLSPPPRGNSRPKRQVRHPLTFRARRNRCFLEIIARYGDPSYELPADTSQFPIHEVGIEVRRLIHLPGLRGNPERTYPVSGVGATFPGTFEKYVANVIAKWQAEGAGSKLEALNRGLDCLGLTDRIVAKPVAETRVELMVGRWGRGEHAEDSDLVSVADVGFGVSQTLPVLVALLVAKPGQAVYLEEPEIHLHPRAQSQMAGVLAEAAIRGVRVIAETHSSILLRGIQTLVAAGRLSPRLVKLHWFTRNPQDGSTEIHSADLDKQGAFGDWPEDFDEVALETEKQYLDAAEASHRS
jgi:hypothetical protein